MVGSPRHLILGDIPGLHLRANEYPPEHRIREGVGVPIDPAIDPGVLVPFPEGFLLLGAALTVSLDVDVEQLSIVIEFAFSNLQTEHINLAFRFILAKTREVLIVLPETVELVHVVSSHLRVPGEKKILQVFDFLLYFGLGLREFLRHFNNFNFC